MHSDTGSHSSGAVQPACYAVDGRDLAAVQGIPPTGAGEALQRSKVEPLFNFIHLGTSPPSDLILDGRVLMAADTGAQSGDARALCRMQGLDVDACASLKGGVECLRQETYRLVIVDVGLSGGRDGLALVRHIRRVPQPLQPLSSRLPILVMAGFEDVARLAEALRDGADDFISKPFSREEFVLRLHRVLQPEFLPEANDVSVPEPMMRAVSDIWQSRGLSLREGEICEALLLGYSDKQIAADFDISFWTVRTHVGNIFSKLGVINRRELMARYLTERER
ncbi:MAG: hypothetical protein BGO63_04465 [Candidatus Accumulibacter sp. 66-26]|nr:response regulator transcription factor [Accumulibacter sp.]OJW48385.1 MAG: hypothetical protein BGO63_04465 [Candidatus Accumulibacter sp. 66-26]